MQEPIRIVLKESPVQVLSGRRRKLVVKKEEYMYIPLHKSLQSLLNNTSIYQEVATLYLGNLTFSHITFGLLLQI